MTEKEILFERLKQIADVVATTFGSSCEVAIHDLTHIKHSLFYLAGNVTRRELGSAVTDAVVLALVREGRNVQDRYGYKTILDDGRELKSSTTYIRDDEGEVVAAFCINVDTTDYINAIRRLEDFVKLNESQQSLKMTQSFAFSINDTIDVLFEQAVAEIGKQPATMSMDEKVKLVGELEKKGAFQIKGIVNQVALRLGVSNFTVYNYLNKIRAKNAVSENNSGG
jgi:predicted transcriptional regulator YheO